MVMLGLLQCSVPPVLKAEILHCLAAFGKSPEIAASLWQSLEYTQVSLYEQAEPVLADDLSELTHAVRLWMFASQHCPL